MAIALGYDAMTGYAMVCLGAMAGFLTGITNPYNVGVAQGIAELALFLWMGLPGILPPALNAIGLFLTIAGIPYVTWIRWVFPYFLLIVSIGVIFLIIAQLINYGPF